MVVFTRKTVANSVASTIRRSPKIRMKENLSWMRGVWSSLRRQRWLVPLCVCLAIVEAQDFADQDDDFDGTEWLQYAHPTTTGGLLMMFEILGDDTLLESQLMSKGIGAMKDIGSTIPHQQPIISDGSGSSFVQQLTVIQGSNSTAEETIAKEEEIGLSYFSGDPSRYPFLADMSGIDQMVVEVGSNDFGTAYEEKSGHTPNKKTANIAFEPVLERFAVHYNTGPHGASDFDAIMDDDSGVDGSRPAENHSDSASIAQLANTDAGSGRNRTALKSRLYIARKTSQQIEDKKQAFMNKWLDVGRQRRAKRRRMYDESAEATKKGNGMVDKPSPVAPVQRDAVWMMEAMQDLSNIFCRRLLCIPSMWTLPKELIVLPFAVSRDHIREHADFNLKTIWHTSKKEKGEVGQEEMRMEGRRFFQKTLTLARNELNNLDKPTTPKSIPDSNLDVTLRSIMVPWREAGQQGFTVTKLDGCSSFLMIDPRKIEGFVSRERDAHFWYGLCGNPMFIRSVPTVSLHKFLTQIIGRHQYRIESEEGESTTNPVTLGRQPEHTLLPVSHLKIDAQGFDLEVVLTALKSKVGIKEHVSKIKRKQQKDELVSYDEQKDIVVFNKREDGLMVYKKGETVKGEESEKDVEKQQGGKEEQKGTTYTDLRLAEIKGQKGTDTPKRADSEMDEANKATNKIETADIATVTKPTGVDTRDVMNFYKADDTSPPPESSSVTISNILKTLTPDKIGAVIKSVEQIQVEITADKCQMPYSSPVTCSQLAAGLAFLNFTTSDFHENCGEVYGQPQRFNHRFPFCQADFLFKNDREYKAYKQNVLARDYHVYGSYAKIRLLQDWEVMEGPAMKESVRKCILVPLETKADTGLYTLPYCEKTCRTHAVMLSGSTIPLGNKPPITGFLRERERFTGRATTTHGSKWRRCYCVTDGCGFGASYLSEGVVDEKGKLIPIPVTEEDIREGRVPPPRYLYPGERYGNLDVYFQYVEFADSPQGPATPKLEYEWKKFKRMNELKGGMQTGELAGSGQQAPDGTGGGGGLVNAAEISVLKAAKITEKDASDWEDTSVNALTNSKSSTDSKDLLATTTGSSSGIHNTENPFASLTANDLITSYLQRPRWYGRLQVLDKFPLPIDDDETRFVLMEVDCPLHTQNEMALLRFVTFFVAAVFHGEIHADAINVITKKQKASFAFARHQPGAVPKGMWDQVHNIYMRAEAMNKANEQNEMYTEQDKTTGQNKTAPVFRNLGEVIMAFVPGYLARIADAEPAMWKLLSRKYLTLNFQSDFREYTRYLAHSRIIDKLHKVGRGPARWLGQVDNLSEYMPGGVPDVDASDEIVEDGDKKSDGSASTGTDSAIADESGIDRQNTGQFIHGKFANTRISTSTGKRHFVIPMRVGPLKQKSKGKDATINFMGKELAPRAITAALNVIYESFLEKNAPFVIVRSCNPHLDVVRSLGNIADWPRVVQVSEDYQAIVEGVGLLKYE